MKWGSVPSKPQKKLPVLSSGNILVRLNEKGMFEGVNPNGSIAWVQDPTSSPRAKNLAARSYLMSRKGTVFRNELGDEIVVPYNTTLLQHYRKAWPYVEELAAYICMRLTEGETLRNISCEDGMPPLYVISRWRVEIPGFQKMMEEARKLRADTYHDEIVDVKDHVGERNAKSSKVRLEALKHLAAVGDPDTYGNRTKVVGDPTAPLNFVFHTGIVREPVEPEAIPAEGKTLVEDEND